MNLAIFLTEISQEQSNRVTTLSIHMVKNIAADVYHNQDSRDDWKCILSDILSGKLQKCEAITPL